MAGMVSWRMSFVWFDLCREFDLCVAVHCAISLKVKNDWRRRTSVAEGLIRESEVFQ